MITINLLPGGTGKSKRRSGGGTKSDFGASFGALVGKVRDPYLVAAIAGVVIGGLGVGGLYTLQEKRAGELAEAERKAVADSTRVANYLKQRTRAEATRDTVLRQINVIRAIDDDRFVWPHVLDEVSAALPEYTWLTTLAIVGTPQGTRTQSIIGPDSAAPAPRKPAKGKAPAKAAADTAIAVDEISVSLTGQTADIEAITRFMRQLEASPFISDVELKKSALTIVEGTEITWFSLEVKFERPPATSGVVRRAPLRASVVPVEGN